MRGRTQTAAANAKLASPSETRRVIIRYANGSLLRGYLNEADVQELRSNALERIAIRNAAGDRETVDAAGLKAIFFVKSFEGSQDYSEFKVFTHQPSGKGVWVRVHFHDGEVMEGIAPNTLATFLGSVFSLTPPDPQSNNETVIVSKNCLENMQILGLASD